MKLLYTIINVVWPGSLVRSPKYNRTFTAKHYLTEPYEDIANIVNYRKKNKITETKTQKEMNYK